MELKIDNNSDSVLIIKDNQNDSNLSSNILSLKEENTLLKRQFEALKKQVDAYEQPNHNNSMPNEINDPKNDFVDVNCLIISERIEEHLKEANRIFTNKSMSKEAFIYVVKNFWNLTSFMYNDSNLTQAKRLLDDLLEKIKKVDCGANDSTSFKSDADLLSLSNIDIELLQRCKASTYSLKNKLFEQNNMLKNLLNSDVSNLDENDLRQLQDITKKIAIENSKLNTNKSFSINNENDISSPSSFFIDEFGRLLDSNEFTRENKVKSLETKSEPETLDGEIIRSIMVVGRTGSGKSKLLNELIGENLFLPNAGIESCTEEIIQGERKIKIKSSTDSSVTELRLICYDTPGIADTKGRSKLFLNKIAGKIKTTPLNQLIVLVEYGKLDSCFYLNLEVLRECLNDLSDASTMIIINKVPTQAVLKRKIKNGEKVPDRDIEIKDFFRKISEKLGSLNSDFRYTFFLENDEYEDQINQSKYETINQVILSSSSLLNASKVRTWDEIYDFYSRDIKEYNEQEFDSKLKQLELEYKDKLTKVEFDIADLKYPFLDYLDKCGRISSALLSSLIHSKQFISDFYCEMTKEEYYKMKRPEINANNNLGKNAATALSSVVVGAATSAAQSAISTSNASTITSLASLDLCKNTYQELTNQLKSIPPPPDPISIPKAFATAVGINEVLGYILPQPLPMIASAATLAGAVGQAASVAATTATVNAQKAAIEESLRITEAKAQELAQEISSQTARNHILQNAPFVLLAAMFGVAACGYFGTKKGLFYIENKDIKEKLVKLDEKRSKLKDELRECTGNIEQKKAKLVQVREKIIRLEALLVNPNQLNH